MPKLEWEKLDSDIWLGTEEGGIYRTPVIGGWLIYAKTDSDPPDIAIALTFVPDPDHSWGR